MADSSVPLRTAAVVVVASCAATWGLARWYFASRRATGSPPACSALSDADADSSAVREGLMGLIGNTPMVRLPKLSKLLGCEILAKAEFLNPGGSSKDRVAKQIVLDALGAAALPADGTIVEGTSGSTGISLSLVARAMGLKCHIVMPDDQAIEKSNLLAKFGATVERVKPVSIVNSRHYVNLARTRAEEIEGGLFTDQFENMSNFRAHYSTTGAEVWRQSQGKVDAFVMGSGTGGTIAGVSRYLKERKPTCEVVLVDPQGSSLYNKVAHGVAYATEQSESRLRKHRYDTIVEGVGIDRLTANFCEAIVDKAYRVTDAEAVQMSRWLLREEGIFVGSSSSINVVGAIRTARRLGPGHTIVTVLCDSGQRHVTRFWNEEYLSSVGLGGVADTVALAPAGPDGCVPLTFIK